MRVKLACLALICLLNGCGTTSTMVPANHIGGSGHHDVVGVKPTKIVFNKDGRSRTMTQPATLIAVAAAINHAAAASGQQVSCHAMSTDSYTIQLYYEHKIRTFTNHGGACQPLIDEQTGKRIPFSGVLATLTNHQ